MGRTTITTLPALQRIILNLGENIRLARLRRRLSATQVSERAGITRPTLRGIERGDPSVSLGAYATVLFCLGLESELAGIAQDDELGRKLQDAQLTPQQRAPRRKRKEDKAPVSQETQTS